MRLFPYEAFSIMIVLAGLTQAGCQGGTVSTAPPQAFGGYDQVYRLCDGVWPEVQLFPLVERFANEGAASYRWDLVAAPQGSEGASQMEGYGFEHLVFRADAYGVFTLCLTAKVGATESLPDCLNIVVEDATQTNLPPLAVIAAPGIAFSRDVIELDGSASLDPEGEGLTFVWELLDVPFGSNLDSSSLGAADRTSFLPDRLGDYRFSLTVKDGCHGVAQALWTVTVLDGDCPYPGPEVCDGVDNDCDGAVDEEPLEDVPSCLAQGVCLGVWPACLDGAYDCVYPPAYQKEETFCDGLDNDCDSSTDEGLQGCCQVGEVAVCGLDQGICRPGTQVCGVDRAFGPCEGATLPEEEVCDGLDNDCDGETDEDPLPGQPTDPSCQGIGVCAGSTWRCSPLLQDWYCEPPPSFEAGQETLCDGLDNDCDGSIDELIPACCIPGKDLDCGNAVGSCTPGKQTCSKDGTYSVCSGQVPTPEVCDGLDNDCDGLVDDGVLSMFYPDEDDDGHGDGLGPLVEACEAPPGHVLLDDDCNDQDPSIHPGAPESCDGVDNDCSGTVDEMPLIDLPQEPCLYQGVCIGASWECRGAGGWICPYPEGYEEDEISCDGQDNDCDGQIDEDLDNCDCTNVGAQEACGTGVGECEEGVRVCLSSNVWGPCSNVGPSPETCDGKDNDCDGTADDNLVPPDICGSAGVCAEVVAYCLGALGWNCPLPPTYEAVEISCDGLDNDCDGAADVNLHPPLDICPQIGVCQQGTGICRGQEGWRCLPPASYEAHETRCDGQDNDCDGRTDEDLTAPPGVCPTEGVCVAAQGVCRGVEGWSCNMPPVYEEVEISCDGQDNDCDGRTDEPGDLVPPPCLLQGSVCQGSLASTCQGARGWAPCGAPEYGPDFEPFEGRCDGLDNDCDGHIDEANHMVPPACPFQAGVCAGAMSPGCRGEEGWAPCTPDQYGDQYEAVEVSCDGVDNDCDGRVDIDLPGPLCGLQQGVCLGSQALSCLGEGGWAPCGTLEYGAHYEPVEVSCDGLDNDCDGLTDEPASLQPSLCSLQQGVCAGTRSPACLGEEGWAPCTAEHYGALYEATETRCDGRDNDCDGLTDEPASLQASLCSLQQGVCAGSRSPQCQGEAGWAACTVATYGPLYEPNETRCDGLDNDCDGTVDDPGTLPAPLCGLQQGICAGTRSSVCQGEAGWAACTAAIYGTHYEPNETRCDGRDNDCDGLEDESLTPPGDVCSSVGVCAQGTPLCDDAWVCQTPPTYQPTESSCSDGLDNDCDSLTDCNDSDCATTCGIELDCDDGLDNDNDGQADCRDPDCWSVCTVGGNDTCLALTAVVTATRSVSGNSSGLYDNTTGSCGGDGPEAVIVLDLSLPSAVIIDIRDPAIDTVLYMRTTCDDPATEIACHDDPSGLGSSLDMGVMAPGTYYLFWDGKTAADAGRVIVNFQITPVVTETDCHDGVDNDLDGMTDCRDVDCELDCAYGSNDTCQSPYWVGAGTINANNTNFIDNYVGSCGGEGVDFLLGLTLDVPSYVVIYTHNTTTVDTVIYVREDCRDPDSEIGCNDDGPTPPTSHLDLGLRPAGDYYIIIDGATPADQGSHKITITVTPAKEEGLEEAR